MRYLLVIDGFGRFAEFSKYARVFRSERKAKDYVSDLHQAAWDEGKKAFKDGEEWDGALLYEINMDGSLDLVNEYDALADSTGFTAGWEKK